MARSKEKGVDTITCSTYSSSAGEDEGAGGARHYLLVLGAKSLDTCVVDGGAVSGGHDGI